MCFKPERRMHFGNGIILALNFIERRQHNIIKDCFFRTSTVIGPKTFQRGEFSININKCFVNNKQFILIEYAFLT